MAESDSAKEALHTKLGGIVDRRDRLKLRWYNKLEGDAARAGYRNCRLMRSHEGSGGSSLRTSSPSDRCSTNGINDVLYWCSKMERMTDFLLDNLSVISNTEHPTLNRYLNVSNSSLCGKSQLGRLQ